MRIVTDENTPLEHDIEIWDLSGESFLWVRIPTMTSATTTRYWLYYGGPIGASNPDSTTVWDNDYLAVWHLHEPVVDEDNSGTHVDATGNGHDANQYGNESVIGNGTIGRAQDLDGNNDTISLTPDGALNNGYGAMTMAARVHLRTDATIEFPHVIAAGGTSDGGRYRQLFWQRDRNGWAARYRAGFNNSLLLETSAGAQDAWAFVASVYDGDQVRFYLDGQSIGTQNMSGTLSSIDSLVIGGNPNLDLLDTSEREFNGYIDEVRISKIARSGDWLDVQARSMEDTLIDFGPTECLVTCP